MNLQHLSLKCNNLIENVWLIDDESYVRVISGHFTHDTDPCSLDSEQVIRTEFYVVC